MLEFNVHSFNVGANRRSGQFVEVKSMHFIHTFVWR